MGGNTMPSNVNVPAVKHYFIPLEQQISAIDLNTGEEIRVEEC